MKDDSYRVMFRQFQGASSQCEKANILLKLRGARQRMKARTGRCEGRKPYGANEGEQVIIARMKELRAAGMASDRIAATLNNAGNPTRTPEKRWHGFAVNQILRRSFTEQSFSVSKGGQIAVPTSSLLACYATAFPAVMPNNSASLRSVSGFFPRRSKCAFSSPLILRFGFCFQRQYSPAVQR